MAGPRTAARTSAEPTRVALTRSGADEGGADDDGGPEDGGADDEDLVGRADPELPGWTDAELIGVGAREVPEDHAAAGLTNEFGDSEAGGEGDALGPAWPPSLRQARSPGFPRPPAG